MKGAVFLVGPAKQLWSLSRTRLAGAGEGEYAGGVTVAVTLSMPPGQLTVPVPPVSGWARKLVLTQLCVAAAWPAAGRLYLNAVRMRP
jgi:hypothetical protein